MDSCEQTATECSNSDERQVSTPSVTSLKTKFKKAQENGCLSYDRGTSVRQKRRFNWPPSEVQYISDVEALESRDVDPFSNLTDTCFDSNEKDGTFSRQSTFELKDESVDCCQNLPITVAPDVIEGNQQLLNEEITAEEPVSHKLSIEQDPSITSNELNSHVDNTPNIVNSLVPESISEPPENNLSIIDRDTFHLALDTSDKQEVKLADRTFRGDLDTESAPDLVSGSESTHDFQDINASSTLKLKPHRLPRIPRKSVNHLKSSPNILNESSVASLLPINRSSAEECALAHIINLETDRSHQNDHPPVDETIGFTGEQDSGVFDLSLVHQEDCDSIENRDSSRNSTVRNTTPEKQRKLTSPPNPFELAQPSELPDVEENQAQSCEVYGSNFRIPTSLLSDLPLFPGLELAEGHCDQRQSLDESNVSAPNCAKTLSIEILPSSVQEDSNFQSDLDLAGEGVQDLDAHYNSISQDLFENINDQRDTMGKKTQSLSKGKQAHMVYSREEFAEEYASPKKSKSLERQKNSSKGSDKKGKGKDRKRILSDPSQGTTLFISAPILPSQEESVRTKRYTSGTLTTPTNEAGTDTTELLEDNDLPANDKAKHLQPRTLPVAENESNNNQDHQHKSKKRLAHSRAGGLSPEIVPSTGKPPLFKQQEVQSSPQVITDTLEDRTFTSGPKEVDLIAGGPLQKPKRLSLTNQLQKHGSLDKSTDVIIVQQNGSTSSSPQKEDLCERKTEIAVERQVLLKQAAKSTSPFQGYSTEAGQQNSRPKIRQQLSLDFASPYRVVTRYIDGEEELILGALPLQDIEQLKTVDSGTPVQIPPRKPSRQLSEGRKFRHYACIEPVGRPVENISPDKKVEPFSAKWPPNYKDLNELTHKEVPEQESIDPAPVTMSPTKKEHDVNVTPIKLVTPPLFVTAPSEEFNSSEKGFPDSPDTVSTRCVQSSPEIVNEASMQTPTRTSPSIEINRSRVNSCTDTASTVSIPPQSPPDLDYQDFLQHHHDQTSSEHSVETPSEPFLNMNLAGTEQRVSEQKMVTVSMGMMPKPQTAKMTIISDETQDIISTDEVDKYKSGDTAQASSSPPTEEEPHVATESLPSTQGVMLRADIPFVSSKEDDEADGDNEEEEDRGVYDASYRYSDWIYVGNNQELTMMTKQLEQQAAKPQDLQTVAEVNKTPVNSNEDGVFDRSDETRESVTTTASEKEFQKQYQSLAYRRIHRKTSAIDYQRLSLIARERKVTVQKINNMFGFRIQYSKPVVVTDIDKGGAAEQAGLRVGDMVLNVNGQDVRQSLHSQVVRLAMTGPDPLHLVVGTNVCNTLNLDNDKPVMSGYLHKLGGAGMIRTWKKRWFVLKHDNCLYYYKTEEDVEPLGAIVLCNYTVVKARDVGKPYAFKLTKCKARTYYFYTVTEEEMSRWAKNITEAAKPHNTSDIWLDISTHNVGLPALSIKNPDCQGFLNKMGAVRKAWKKRFCVLKDACLYYYKDMDAQHALGVAHFHGYSIQENEIGSKKFGLILKPPSEELRVFYFFADHETDRKRWVAAFASSIGRWIQTNNGEESEEESPEMLI